jgi:2,4-dienoyl-CoA reductase-like NADH-dependent reductase (Old Yellow Enzyme family)
MVPTATRIRHETGVATAVSWNVGDPGFADKLIRDGQVDLLMLGRPMIANPHWPLYAALALGRNAAYEMLPKQYGHALLRSRDAEHCSGFGPLHVEGPAAS